MVASNPEATPTAEAVGLSYLPGARESLEQPEAKPKMLTGIFLFLLDE